MVKVWYKPTILPRSLMSDFKYNYEARMIESKRIDDTINIKPKSTILELGAGSGHLSHYLLRMGIWFMLQTVKIRKLKTVN